MPGCTHAVFACASNSITALRYLLWSMTSASPTVWPHCDVPPPRGRHRHACFGGDLQGADRVLFGARHDDPDRHDLVDRGVGAVAAAAESVEQDFALHFLAQARGHGAFLGMRMQCEAALWRRAFIGRVTAMPASLSRSAGDNRGSARAACAWTVCRWRCAATRRQTRRRREATTARSCRRRRRAALPE